MDKKEKICRAAAKVIAREGYHNTRVPMIAKEADIAVGSIYNYFTSKEELLEYIFEEENQKRISYLNLLELQDKTPLEKFKAFWEYHMDKLRENIDIAATLMQQLVMTPKDTQAKKSLSSIQEKLVKLLEEAKINGEIKDINAKVIVSIVATSMRGIIYTKQFMGDNSEYDTIKRGIMDFIISGIIK